MLESGTVCLGDNANYRSIPQPPQSHEELQSPEDDLPAHQNNDKYFLFYCISTTHGIITQMNAKFTHKVNFG